MNHANSLGSRLILSRLVFVGTEKFANLGLTQEEIQLFVTEANRKDWTESMRKLIPDLENWLSDEEEE